MKNVQGAVYTLAKSVKDGKPETGVVRGSLENGGVSVSNSNQTFSGNADIQAAIKKAEEGIKNGTITVKTS